MKLEEAAALMGVSLDNITPELLKQTYKKLALSWDPQQNKEMTSKQRYLQVSEAYRKLSSVMDTPDGSPSSPTGRDREKGEDSHEIAAFMRIFMDMVGMSESDSIPAAMTFGMMFGSRHDSMDEWSTDDDEEYGDDEDEDDEDDEEDDEEEDDEEFIPGEYYEDFSRLNIPQKILKELAWEPQVKQYSNMNLKDSISREKKYSADDGEKNGDGDEDDDEEEDDDGLTEVERLKKEKLAKKKAEKRRKQKEKKQREMMNKANDDKSIEDDMPSNEAIEQELLMMEYQRELANYRDKIKAEILNCVKAGRLPELQVLLSYDFESYLNVATSVSEDIRPLIQSEIEGYLLLHKCVTEFPMSKKTKPNDNAVHSTSLSDKRLEVAKYLLTLKNPRISIAQGNADGLTVLHLAVHHGDRNYTSFLLSLRAKEGTPSNYGDRREEIGLDQLCTKRGWTPMHYAIDRGDLPLVKSLIQAGSNMHLTAGKDKKLTALEFAKAKLKGITSNSLMRATIQTIYNEVYEAVNHKKTNSGLADSNATKTDKNSSNIKSEHSGSQTSAGVVEQKCDNIRVAQAANKSIPSSATTETEASMLSDKKKKKDKLKENKKASGKIIQEETVNKNVSPTEKVKSEEKSTNAKNDKKNKASDSPAPSGAGAALSIVSRDELVDRLLAMGFKEKDCLAAVALYGTDIDRAISWLCERPNAINTKTSEGSSNNNGSNSRTSGQSSPEMPKLSDDTKVKSVVEVKPVKHTTIVASSPAPVTTAPSSSSKSNGGTSGVSVSTQEGKAAKLQKEKEDLRKINRAWNSKAEEEKRKEQLRRQQELEKQQELAAQKQSQLQYEKQNEIIKVQQMKYLQEHYSNNNYNNFTGSYTQNLFANPTEVSSNAVAIDSLGGINNLAVTQDSNSVNNATGDISEPTNAKKLSALNIGEAIEMAYGKNSKKKADYPLKHKNSGAHGSRNRTTSETVGSNVDNSVNASSGFGELQSRILSKHTFDYNTVNIPESPWGINSASKQSLAPPVAPGSVVGSNVGPINGGLNSAVNSLGNTNFFNESLFNGSLLTNEQFPGKNIPISANNEKDDFIIVDGAVELSAGARPFVPKSLPIRNSAGTIGKSSKTTNSDVLGPNQSLFSSDILSGTNLDLLHPESTTTDSLGISSNAVNKGINHSLNIDGSGLSGLGSLGISENRALLDDLISGSTSGLSHSDLWSSLGSNTSTFGLNSTNWAHANTTAKEMPSYLSSILGSDLSLSLDGDMYNESDDNRHFEGIDSFLRDSPDQKRR